jgi:hypothetical protein
MVGTFDIAIGPKMGDTRQDYLEWRSQVLAVRDLPEYKLRKLWKLNFSAKDIAANKHWEVFPPQELRKRVKPGMAVGEGRGKAITARGRQRAYAQALLDKARHLLQFHRLDSGMLALVRQDVVVFQALVARFKKVKRKA